MGCLLEPAKRHYSVTGPEYGEVIPILDDGSGPMEYGCDFCVVEARTKREARQLAAKHPDMARTVDYNRGDNLPPWAHLTVDVCDCGHGHCWECNDDPTEVCDECRAWAEATTSEPTPAADARS